MSNSQIPVTQSFDGVVEVLALPAQGMVTLRGDLADERLREAVHDTVGVEVPLVRRADFQNGRGVIWMSQDELLLIVAAGQGAAVADSLQTSLAGGHAMAVDVSDARVVFELRGRRLREVIAKLAPVDMSPDAFTPGDFRRTRFGQIAAAFWLVDDTCARVICFRSVADYMFGMLCHAADPAAELIVY